MVSATRATILTLAIVAVVSSAAVAQQPSTEEPIGAVFAFNRICYSQVPDTQGIENMALQLGWNPLAPSQMEAFGKSADFAYFKGWDVQLGEEFYRLGLTQSGVSDALASEFPGFADGKTTSCSLVIGDEEDATTVAEQMQGLAGKEPASSNVDEGAVLTTTWAGGNDDFKVFLFNKVSKTNEGGILNVTLISKE